MLADALSVICLVAVGSVCLWMVLVRRSRANREVVLAEEQRKLMIAERIRKQQADGEEKRRRTEEIVGEVIDRYSEIVQRFLSIAERAVSTLDEYGDENWNALDREIFRCIEKIAEREKWQLVDWGTGKHRSHFLSGGSEDVHLSYEMLSSRLDQRFRAYHAEQALTERSLNDMVRMTGLEFEGYLMGLLKRHGCSVSGTPKTGDKGADILARIDERVIVIQAKRSASPVGTKAVQEVVAAVAYYGGTEAWVMTNSTFTQAARELAGRNRVRLVAQVDLASVGDLLRQGAREI